MLPLLLAAAAEADQGSEPYHHHMWGGGGWMGWIMGPVMMVAMIAIVVAVVALVGRWLGGSAQGWTHRTPLPERTPLDILKERYARGEIDKEEFEERRRVLDS